MFGGFALGELVEVREIGVGMTVAVLLDVTVVRGLLLPATMTLLGRRNWWPGDFWDVKRTNVLVPVTRLTGLLSQAAKAVESSDA